MMGDLMDSSGNFRPEQGPSQAGPGLVKLLPFSLALLFLFQICPISA